LYVLFVVLKLKRFIFAALFGMLLLSTRFGESDFYRVDNRNWCDSGTRVRLRQVPMKCPTIYV